MKKTTKVILYLLAASVVVFLLSLVYLSTLYDDAQKVDKTHYYQSVSTNTATVDDTTTVDIKG